MNPRSRYPLRLWDAIEVYPEIGYHGTLYRRTSCGFASRHLFTAQLDVRTRLRRVVRSCPSAAATRCTCSSRHFVTWTGITDESQSDNPLFTPQPLPSQHRLPLALAAHDLTRD